MDRNDEYMLVSIDQRKKPSKETEEIGPNAEQIDVNP
jgi:hypothetical protein